MKGDELLCVRVHLILNVNNFHFVSGGCYGSTSINISCSKKRVQAVYEITWFENYVGSHTLAGE